jgi:outer membrane protein TolC
MIRVDEENMTLLSYLERVIRARYTAGEDNQSALAKVQVEIGILEEQLQSLKDMSGATRAKLNAVLNLPSDYPQPLPEYLPDAAISLSVDSLTVLIHAHNPVIASIRMKTLMGGNGVELAQKQYYPDFMLGVGTERLMNKPMNGNRNSVMGMFSITLPVWRSSYSHTLKAAQASEQSSKKELESERNNRESELHEVMFRYRDTERKISLYRDSLIPKTRELLAVTQRAYEAGKTDFLDFIDSQRTLIELELNYERALTDRIQAVSQIEIMIDETLISSE